MKKILGLDLGTNSIGWALVQQNFEEKKGQIIGMGSRIIPMDAAKLGEFEKGNSISATAERTKFRGVRRLYERDVLRRERLHRVLHILDFLPTHYAENIDFELRLGQFLNDKEPKLAYKEELSGKFNFIFKESFAEMVEDFRKTQPQLFYRKSNGEETKIPYDWTLYYLRKKALTKKIDKEELAWLLLNFNQKRGYYQLRGEDEEVDDNKNKSFEVLKVGHVIDSGDKIKGTDTILYDIYFENGWKYDKQITKTEDWIGKTKEFIVTTDTLSSGELSRKYKKVNSEEDWIAIKEKTEQDISNTNKTVGQYIYDTLLQKPNQKIRGKLIRTIERKYYKKELIQILNMQKKFHPELQNRDLYNACVEELYKNNESHRYSITNKDFTYFFVDDIIFYQRPLKSKKSLISNCTLEYRNFKNEDGTTEKVGIKCIPKSHPFYQEFRLLQWFKNLKIFRKEDLKEIDVTDELLATITDKEMFFEWLNDKIEIDLDTLLKYKPFGLEEKIKKHLGIEEFRNFKKNKEQGLHTYYRWNYVEDKKYPLNITRGEIIKRLNKLSIETTFLNIENETHLWHILYSIDAKEDIEKALKKYANKHNLSNEFVEVFKKFPKIEKEYGAFSSKAINKLLPLMRFGKWWKWETIDEYTKQRINKIITGEYDEKIKTRVREKAIDLTTEEDFKNLPLWLASYIIYDRHAESSDSKTWKTANDIELIKQHELRNPIVEQVINETLQTVKEIWNYYGDGKEKFFDEIHVELGREMKSTKKEREKTSERMIENENTNIRLKALLVEMFNDRDMENIRPYSPMQQEVLKIYEEGIYNNPDTNYSIVGENEINKIRKKNNPTSSDLKRYKLWLEQGYKSPYTGEIIPLAKLFTPAYEIEHIIPQSRYFDDSLSNKIICESEVNKIKDNQLAFEFIKNNRELKIELSHGKYVKLLSPEAYEANVKRYFSNKDSRNKLKKLLLEEIPESFIERQLNDTRYISKVVKTLLSNIVRENNEEEVIAKNVIVTSGGITSKLKQEWGLNDVWNSLITPRFVRLNNLAGFEKYGSWENKEGKRIFQINTIEPELLKLNKKRIDHRHHALDALVVACCTRNHRNYLNNDNANGKDKTKPRRYDLRNQLRTIEEIEVVKTVNGVIERKKIRVANEFIKPWETFTIDVKEALNNIVVSFKKNNRVINKTVNHYQKWVKQPDGSMKKTSIAQTKGDHWAIRKPLHVLLPYGKIESSFENMKIAENVGKRNLIIDKYIRDQVEEIFIQNDKKIKEAQEQIKCNPIKDKAGNEIITTDFLFKNIKFRKRKSIFDLSNRGSQGGIKTLEQMIKLLNKISDLQLKNDLFKHLLLNNNDINDAFSIEGIERFNEIRRIPVNKLPIAESGNKRFKLGFNKGSKHKWVEVESGTNLFYAIYEDETGKRNFESIPLIEVVEHQKSRATLSKPEINQTPLIPINRDKGRLLFYLSPNDLVYLPIEEELENPHVIDFNKLNHEQVKRIYKFVSCTEGEGHFIPQVNASEIIKNENGTNSKSERMQDFFDGKTVLDVAKKPIQIKSVCWKLETDRLGNITKVNNKSILKTKKTDSVKILESDASIYINDYNND